MFRRACIYFLGTIIISLSCNCAGGSKYETEKLEQFSNPYNSIEDSSFFNYSFLQWKIGNMNNLDQQIKAFQNSEEFKLKFLINAKQFIAQMDSAEINSIVNKLIIKFQRNIKYDEVYLINYYSMGEVNSHFSSIVGIYSDKCTGVKWSSENKKSELINKCSLQALFEMSKLKTQWAKEKKSFEDIIIITHFINNKSSFNVIVSPSEWQSNLINTILEN